MVCVGGAAFALSVLVVLVLAPTPALTPAHPLTPAPTPLPADALESAATPAHRTRTRTCGRNGLLQTSARRCVEAARAIVEGWTDGRVGGMEGWKVWEGQIEGVGGVDG